MHKYETLKRCHLPDLDLTLPACRGITWGRPLTQEEMDHMRAWAQADARRNVCYTVQHFELVKPKDAGDIRFQEFKWHKMVMKLLERE